METRIVINLEGVRKLRKMTCRIGISRNDPMTARALMGSSYVAILSPNT